MRLIRNLLLAFIALNTSFLSAQSSGLMLAGTGGGMNFGNSVFLSYSFGEPLSSYSTTGNEWLTEGVQQPEKINLSVGTKDIQSPASFRFYPNPVDDILHLEWSEEWDCKRIRIDNNTGQTMIDHSSAFTHNETIRVGHLMSGVYYLRMTNIQNHEFIQAFIKI